ncbi:MAG: hypothetical protein MJ252_29605 [archaeon]|nr:hypothetical protein [archaeon]
MRTRSQFKFPKIDFDKEAEKANMLGRKRRNLKEFKKESQKKKNPKEEKKTSKSNESKKDKTKKNEEKKTLDLEKVVKEAKPKLDALASQLAANSSSPIMTIDPKDLLNEEALKKFDYELNFPPILIGRQNSNLSNISPVDTIPINVPVSPPIPIMVKREGYKDPVPQNLGSGLENLGNTCFVNSVLQCLLYLNKLLTICGFTEHEEDMGAFWDSSHQIKMKNPKTPCFVCLFRNLFRITKINKETAVAPKKIIKNLTNMTSNFERGVQGDAHEFLLYFILALEMSCDLKSPSSENNQKRPLTRNYYSKAIKGELSLNEPSVPKKNYIDKIFQGEMISSITCGKCKNISTCKENFIDISLDVMDSNNIYSSFAKYCEIEQLEGENQYYCEICKEKRDSVKQLLFRKFPKILILHLKRFDNKQRKITKKIDFEREINLKDFYYHPEGKERRKYIFRLKAVLLHQGNSIYSGHYFSYVNVTGQEDWYCFNDTIVKRIDPSLVYDSKPYILFYEKLDKETEKNEILNVK